MQSSAADGSIAEEVRRFLVTHIHQPWRQSELTDELPIGPEGLGLDSIAIVELLLACEQRWQAPFPAELLEQAQLTVGSLIHHVQRFRLAQT